MVDVVLPPFRQILRRDAEVLSQHLRGGSRRGEPDDGAGTVRCLPGSPECVHRGRLARASRSHQHVDDAARTGDLCEGRDLVVRQHSPARQLRVRRRARDRRGNPRAGDICRPLKQPGLRGKQCGRREYR